MWQHTSGSMRLYNTLTRRKDELPPPPGPIGMYVCGPTVYDRAHVGNARPFVVFSWLRNWLRERGYVVTFVHNITDVNDKIYEAAPGASAQLAARATQWYLEDTAGLGLGVPDVVPKATETIPEIVELIDRLVGAGFAYEAGGDVYFRVARYADYGQLSGQRPDQVDEQEPSPLKQDPRDFALWKANKPGEDTWWESPWGRGRPGWHIECSAMAEKYLGPRFEIHGAGLDIVFPHNENELAQSRALGHEFARIWMHNGMLRFVGEKMSKSLGNVMTLRAALDEWGRETLLVYFLTGLWRSPIDFTDDALAAARTQWESFRDAFRVAHLVEDAPSWDDFGAALDDDFNTPEALAIMHRWRASGQLELLDHGLSIFGLSVPAEVGEVPSDVRALAERRQEARVRRDFAEGDRLRDEIAALGWEVQDVADGFRLIPRR